MQPIGPTIAKIPSVFHTLLRTPPPLVIPVATSYNE